MNRKISMVMACYNCEPYLDKMLQSIVEQTWNEHLELITVNGSSNDDTSEKLRKWSEIFSCRGFELYNYELPGSSIVEALNEALRHVTGDFISFPDSDDYMLPEYCSELVAALDSNPGLGWAKGDAVLVSENMDILGFRQNRIFRKDIKNDFVRYLLEYDQPDIWACMIRYAYLKRCLPDMRIENALSQEVQLSIPLTYYGNYVHVPKVLYYNIRHEGSGYYRRMTSYEKATEYFESYVTAVGFVLGRLEIEPEYRERCYKAIRLRYLRQIYQAANMHGIVDVTLSEKLIAITQNILGIEIDKKIAASCFEIVCLALMDMLMGVSNDAGADVYDTLRGNSFIIYGAGMKCAEILPALLELGLFPSEIWDIAIKDGDNVSDIPIKRTSTLQSVGINIKHSDVLRRYNDCVKLVNTAKGYYKGEVVLMAVFSGEIEQTAVSHLRDKGFERIISYEMVGFLLKYLIIKGILMEDNGEKTIF